jgi:hypothetical protein
MALADPQSIKISGTTSSLPRINADNYNSEYLSADGTVKFKAGTQFGKRLRQLGRVDINKIVASTLNPSQNEEVSASIQLVFDRPKQGFTNADMLAIYAGLIEQLSATESKIVKQILAAES